jgi:hypothetical protein
MTRSTVLVRALIVAGAVTVALSGCVPGGSAGDSQSPASVDETVAPAGPAPTPSVTALAGDVLFQITATATAPGGAVVALRETVHAPRPVTPTDEVDLDANACDGWRSMADPLIQDGELVATAISGSWPANQNVVVQLGRWAIFDGSFVLAQAYCSPGWLGLPGSSTGRQVIPGADADSGGGWATQQYGFISAVGGTPGPGDIALSDCAIELGPGLSGTSALALAWPAQTQPYAGSSCRFGG